MKGASEYGVDHAKRDATRLGWASRSLVPTKDGNFCSISPDVAAGGLFNWDLEVC